MEKWTNLRERSRKTKFCKCRENILTYHFYNTNLLSYITIPQDKGSKIKLKPRTTLYKVNTKQTFGNRHYTIYVCATTWIFYKTRHWGWFFSLNFDNKKRSKIKHKQDRFFSMKWYKNQVIGMSGHTGQTEKRKLAVEASFLFSPHRMGFTCRVFMLYVYWWLTLRRCSEIQWDSRFIHLA